MSPDSPLANLDIHSGGQRGSRLTLFANRLVQLGGNSMETVAVAHIAAVRVEFARDERKIRWAVALLILALVLAAVSGPLQGWIGSAMARIGEPARRESLDAVLLGVFMALEGAASLLPALAAALAAGALALAVFFWIGFTSIMLCFGAAERSYTVSGRNRHFFEFADAVAERLAARRP